MEVNCTEPYPSVRLSWSGEYPKLEHLKIVSGLTGKNQTRPESRYMLECRSLASISNLFQCLWVHPEPIQVNHLSGLHCRGKLLASQANIRLGREGSSLLRTFVNYTIRVNYISGAPL
jgi:hypothetical protein